MAKLAKKETKKQNDTVQQIVGPIIEYCLALVFGLLCLIVPLYLKQGYYKVGVAKFNAYKNILFYGLPIILILCIVYICFDLKTEGMKQYTKKMYQNLCTTDYFVIAYLLFVFVSDIACGFAPGSFWGYDGWNMGLFAQISFAIIYFLLSRFGKGWKFVLGVLTLTSFYVFIIGILHRLNIDPIGTYTGIDDYYKTLFLSTLGQASWYSSFVCTVLPLGIASLYLFRKRRASVFWGVYVFVGFMTLVTQNSDSAYIAVGLLLLVLLYFAKNSAEGMKRWCMIVFLFFCAPKMMFLCLKIHPNPILSLDQISLFLLEHAISYCFVILMLILVLVFAMMEKNQKYPERFFKFAYWGMVYLVLFLLLVSVILLVLGAKGLLPENIVATLQKLPYLYWDDRWGNGRGFTWEATAKMWKEMTLRYKLFGVGPDQFASYAYAGYEEYIRSKWGDNILTNAHNEWLNTIFTFGVFGGLSYMGIYISSIRNVAKKLDNPLAIAVILSAVSYMGHNLFCYQQILCTPFIMIIMAFGVYENRKK